ncbi:hypothetical protein B0H63DRAFT_459607 [Podospora didyma]|uniref:Uncharacterized protein n=1 Tax=Podospora didyma TaxID=330526 RepID=A0AAE0P646_9PEZI|nr:hypothetical protein B0H63DRAFT_459607 [Podospora didyma]
MANVVLLGTCDTKLEELLYLREQILLSNEIDQVILMDVGRTPVENKAITVSQSMLTEQYGGGKKPSDLPRGELIKFMSECATESVRTWYKHGMIHAIVAAGGSGATSLAAPVMRDALPIGFPKLIVSTVASGDTGPYVGETDITMMYSVVDIAGLNQVLRDVLANAGAAIAGAAVAYRKRQEQKLVFPLQTTAATTKRRVGITMFGVTTPGVDAIRRHLESVYPVETFVFHATGHGGKAMERLIREGQLDAVLDLTTTEVTDHITGGVMSAGPDRLSAAAASGIPSIVSLGATEMTNFGPKTTVPEKFNSRKLYEHNPVVTLMRLSEDECRQIGEFICEKLKAAKDPKMVQVWIPQGGLSMLSTKGAPFEDTQADEVLFETVRKGLEGSGIQVVEDERDVNDSGFAKDIAEALANLMGL